MLAHQRGERPGHAGKGVFLVKIAIVPKIRCQQVGGTGQAVHFGSLGG